MATMLWQKVILEIFKYAPPPPSCVHFAFSNAINTLPSCGRDIYYTWPSAFNRNNNISRINSVTRKAEFRTSISSRLVAKLILFQFTFPFLATWAPEQPTVSKVCIFSKLLHPPHLKRVQTFGMACFGLNGSAAQFWAVCFKQLSLQPFLTIFDNPDNWLQFWQLKTWIHDNLDLTAKAKQKSHNAPKKWT